MALREREEREIAAAQRSRRIGDDGTQPGHAPARPGERRGGRVLTALQLGNAEGHEMRIEERAAALQHGEEPAVHRVEGGLERRTVRPSGERQRLPREAVEMCGVPRPLEGGGIGSDQEGFESTGKPIQGARRFHLHQATPPPHAGKRRLSTSIWKTGWKPCGNVAIHPVRA